MKIRDWKFGVHRSWFQSQYQNKHTKNKQRNQNQQHHLKRKLWWGLQTLACKFYKNHKNLNIFTSLGAPTSLNINKLLGSFSSLPFQSQPMKVQQTSQTVSALSFVSPPARCLRQSTCFLCVVRDENRSHATYLQPGNALACTENWV